jgi:hypothetical protein
MSYTLIWKIRVTDVPHDGLFTIGLAAFQDVICNDSMFVVILCHPLSFLQYMLSTEIGVKIFLDQNILYAILSLCWLPIIQSI